MTDDVRDPLLTTLFEDPPATSADEAFVGAVLAETVRARRRARMTGWSAAGLIALLVFGLEGAFLPLSGFLLQSLVELGDGVIAQVLAPVNTVGTVLSCAVLSARAFFRRVVRRVA